MDFHPSEKGEGRDDEETSSYAKDSREDSDQKARQQEEQALLAPEMKRLFLHDGGGALLFFYAPHAQTHDHHENGKNLQGEAIGKHSTQPSADRGSRHSTEGKGQTVAEIEVSVFEPNESPEECGDPNCGQ